MSKRSRTGFSQDRHDRKVLQLAEKYRRKGYDVKADDVSGFPDPGSIRGRVPDVVAKKNGHTTVIEVETDDSVGTTRDRKQRAKFKRWAGRKKTRHFRGIIV
ncbi:hypothetical protein AKJ36_00105 [candidate division MSBL1 archaeon SCGC-AAA259I07]|uniref:REase AHJR-like domain-containing protein n=1 Tax=candidate division MSBL1 archaeon SCGC-AAA259I07 TaxID=1698266 RepID=A0A133UN30_9EURY|nr:hypothetical protein AKJ36_00105 [candidate division MSBL1 archaeon SCGC-AAA259I07]